MIGISNNSSGQSYATSHESSRYFHNGTYVLLEKFPKIGTERNKASGNFVSFPFPVCPYTSNAIGFPTYCVNKFLHFHPLAQPSRSRMSVSPKAQGRPARRPLSLTPCPVLRSPTKGTEREHGDEGVSMPWRLAPAWRHGSCPVPVLRPSCGARPRPAADAVGVWSTPEASALAVRVVWV